MTSRPSTPDIEDHGAIGDCETIALTSTNGDIDWLCWPRADAASVFGALLDPDGGHWLLRPTGEIRRSTHFYVSETNVLVTRFQAADGIVEIDDAMAMEGRQRLVRRVRCVRGTATIALELVARPGYGTEIASLSGGGTDVRIQADTVDLRLTAPGALTIDGDRIVAEYELAEGASVGFVLDDHDDEPLGIDVDGGVDALLDATTDWWKRWSAPTHYEGRYRQLVVRSALALKLLTNRSTGGVLAAATTSLPETLGGERNWDYRYVWIRDAAFTVYALLELGHTTEADAFVRWLIDRVDECDVSADAPLAPLYDLDGNAKLDEIELDWAGYEDSRPVRVGNAAADQIQLDIYGELIDSLYLFDKHARGLSLDTWDKVRRLVDHVIDHWRDPDDGMWESRDGRRHHTSSLLMCWVAVERAIRMADFRGRPAPLERWRDARDEIHETLAERAWNDDVGAFTQLLDDDQVDAAILLAPLVKFVDGQDPRWLSTLDVVIDRLAHGPLVDRYDRATYDDGLDGIEGAFTICSFWLVEALARAGRVDDARNHFDQLVGFANPLGLYSEQIGPTGRQLGNTPQAFTHLALISAAVALDDAERGDFPA